MLFALLLSTEAAIPTSPVSLYNETEGRAGLDPCVLVQDAGIQPAMHALACITHQFQAGTRGPLRMQTLQCVCSTSPYYVILSPATRHPCLLPSACLSISTTTNGGPPTWEEHAMGRISTCVITGFGSLIESGVLLASSNIALCPFTLLGDNQDGTWRTLTG